MSWRHSIQARLVVVLVAGLLVLLACSGGVLFWLVRGALLEQYDASLAAKARALGSLIKEEKDRSYEFEYGAEAMPEFERPQSPEYFQIWQPDGEVLERSHALKSASLRALGRSGSSGEPAFEDLRLPDGRPGRAVGVRLMPQLDDEALSATASHAKVLVVVARERAGLDQMLAILLATVGIVTLVVALGSGLLVGWAVRRGLLPLRELAAQVARIGPASLASRLQADCAPRELAPICACLNDLLARLEQGFERERRFSSDVSHELRTPIAEAKTALELALRWPDDPQLVRSSCQQAGEAVRDMETIVSTLLTLTRSSSGMLAVQGEEVDISQLLEQVCTGAGSAAAERDVQLAFARNGAVRVHTCRALLKSIVQNIVQNAVVHSPEGSTVELSLGRSGQHVEVAVTNPAPELEPGDVGCMFDPFWRKDASRSDREHLGLGLTLAQSFARLVGAEVRAQLLPGQALRVMVCVPDGGTQTQ